MALSPRLDVRQRQTLVMTPQMQQAVKLLQMNNAELEAHVQAFAEANPLIELRPPDPGGAQATPARGASPGDADPLAGIADTPSLWDHLRDQIRSMPARAEHREAALLLADELEDDGYLREPLIEVARRHRLSAEATARGLRLVQACDPTGVGARDLSECFALQLRERNRLDPAMEALLADLSRIMREPPDRLAAACGVDREDLEDMLAELRGLDPKPGLRFSEAQMQPRAPDIHVTALPGGGLRLEIDTSVLPRVLVDNSYASSVGAADPGARLFISECRASANWLVRAMEQRARTILRVADAVVRHQSAFFEHGAAGLRPLTRREVAAELSLHESTVSRVAAGKSLACALGIYDLGYFFGSGVPATGGGEAVSARAVQERIVLAIEAEDARRPLSDDRLARILRDEGIDVARRTVAKYREGLGIGSSTERRRRNTRRAVSAIDAV